MKFIFQAAVTRPIDETYRIVLEAETEEEAERIAEECILGYPDHVFHKVQRLSIIKNHRYPPEAMVIDRVNPRA